MYIPKEECLQLLLLILFDSHQTVPSLFLAPANSMWNIFVYTHNINGYTIPKYKSA